MDVIIVSQWGSGIMKKIAVQNLSLIITEQCTLQCAHCLRGSCSNRVMSDEVINATFDQIKTVGNLCICGGEPTLALDRLEKIIDVIIEKKVLVDAISIVINGTRYEGKFLELLKYFEDDVYSVGRKKKILFSISWDQYHHDEVRRLNMLKEYAENVMKYSESKYFYQLNRFRGKIFREGRAENLAPNLTAPFIVMNNIISYIGKFGFEDRENGLCNIGPMVAVNTQGIITDCNASYEHQETIYNYGNVLTDSIEDVLLKDCVIVKPSRFYRCLGKEIKHYHNFNK